MWAGNMDQTPISPRPTPYSAPPSLTLLPEPLTPGLPWLNKEIEVERGKMTRYLTSVLPLPRAERRKSTQMEYSSLLPPLGPSLELRERL